MYALLIYLRIDRNRAPEAARAFTSHVLPSVRSSKGFLNGYWLDPADDQGFGFVIFDTERDAENAIEQEAHWKAPGVVIERFQVRRVAVKA